MLRTTITLIIAFILCIETTTAQDEYTVKQELDSLAQAYLEGILRPKGRKPIYNIQMSLTFKDKYEFHGAAGTVKKKGQPVTADHKFKIASVTKTFTSVIILQMMEEGKLSLSDPISDYFDADFVDRLLIVDGDSQGQFITIEHLLDHTSGLRDYIFEDWRFILGLLFKPRRMWTPDLLFDTYFKHHLNTKSKLKPGDAFHYSDTNYLLLALIIEQLSGKSLADNYRLRIAEPLGLTSTYLDPYDLDTAGMMHQYRKRRNITTKFNTSMDFGGGGIISTTRELSIFIRALLDNELFEDPSTLDLMVTCDSLDDMTYGYNFGIERQDFPVSEYLDGAKDTMTIFGHSGYWSVYMYAFPEKDISLVMSIGQVKDTRDYNPMGRLLSDCFARFEPVDESIIGSD